MKKLTICPLLAALVLLASGIPAPAQYALKYSQFSNGTAKLSGGSSQLQGSAGLFQSGRLSNAANALRGGFWEHPPSLAAPTQVAVGGATQPSFTPTLDWGDGFGVNSYTLEYAHNAGFTDSKTITNLTASQYTFPAPLADGTYFWRVKAIGPCAESGFSAADSFVIIPTLGEWTLLLLALAMLGYMLWYNHKIRKTRA